MRLISTSIPADSPARNESYTAAKDPFSALTLASEDPVSAFQRAPVPRFGQPSLPLDELLVPTPRKRVGLSPSPELEEMDWAPTSASATKITSPPRAWASSSTNFQLGPQRFFPPEAPTGLDDAFSQALDFKRAEPARPNFRSRSDIRNERLRRERRARNLSACLALGIGIAAAMLWLRGSLLASLDLSSVRKIMLGQGEAMQAQTPLVPAHYDQAHQSWESIVVTYLAEPQPTARPESAGEVDRGQVKRAPEEEERMVW